MELQLPQLQGLSRGHVAGRARTQSSIAVADGADVGPGERLAGYPGAIAVES